MASSLPRLRVGHDLGWQPTRGNRELAPHSGRQRHRPNPATPIDEVVRGGGGAQGIDLRCKWGRELIGIGLAPASAVRRWATLMRDQSVGRRSQRGGQ
jgi:hypothetical protein